MQYLYKVSTLHYKRNKFYSLNYNRKENVWKHLMM